MKLAVFNGSPRGVKSNTRILLDHFLAGFAAGGQEQVPQHYLMKLKHRAEQLQAFAEADCILLAFPLYTDSMPGIVKEFIESLATIQKSPDCKMGFIVQSGFPEAEHAEHVEAYLKKLTRRLGVTYLGTIIKGGVEGMQMRPDKMNRTLYDSFHAFGKDLAERGTWDEARVTALRKPRRFGPLTVLIFKVMAATGMVNFYWDANLRQNQAYERRFDRPYQPPAGD
jgi:multimeric flavodoxin WrbA